VWSVHIIPIKIRAGVFVEIKKLILKLMWKHKRPRNAILFSRTREDRRLALHTCLYHNYKAIVIKTM